MLYVTAEVIRQVAILAQPVMPASAAKLLDLLGVPATSATSPAGRRASARARDESSAAGRCSRAMSSPTPRSS